MLYLEGDEVQSPARGIDVYRIKLQYGTTVCQQVMHWETVGVALAKLNFETLGKIL